MLGSGTAVTALLGMVYNVYAGRTIGPVEYADFVAGLSLVYLGSIAAGPINSTVTRFTALYASRRSYGQVRSLHRAVLKRVVLYALAAACVGAVLAMPLAALLRFQSVSPILASIGIVCLTMVLSVSRGVLRGNQDFGRHTLNLVLDSALRLAAGVLFLSVARGASAGLAAYLFALAAMVLVSRLQVKRIWDGYASRPLDGLAVRRAVAPMVLVSLGNVGLQNLDLLLVKHFFSGADAGVYGAAGTLARSMAVVLTPFSTFLLPRLTTLHSQGRNIRGSLARTCGGFLIAASALLCVFWQWPDRLVAMVFGAPFAEATAILLPLALAFLAASVSGLVSLAFVSIDRLQFLWIHVAGLATLAVGLWAFHESLRIVVTVVLSVQVGIVVALGAWFLAASRSLPAEPREGHDADLQA